MQIVFTVGDGSLCNHQILHEEMWTLQLEASARLCTVVHGLTKVKRIDCRIGTEKNTSAFHFTSYDYEL
jgi:hypothetical protein